jgi:amino acid transporter
LDDKRVGLGWLAVLLYADAVISPGGTGLIYTGSSSRMTFSMARGRYIPSIFAAISSRHVPLLSILLAMVLGFLFLLPSPSWQGLIAFITNATILSYGLQPPAMAALRRQVPNHERPFRLALGEVIAPVSFIIANLIIYWGGWETNWRLMLAILLGFVLMGLNYLLSPRDQRPDFDWRAAYWLVPYLGGLTLISFIGARDFHGRGLISFGWDALVVSVFSVVIYVLALNLRLADGRARAYIDELSAEAEAEEEILAASA